jgi:hemoglobin-like flavoprotein
MTQEHIHLVQTSFVKIGPMAQKVAELFYARLFALDPTLKALFRGDMQAQGAKLMQAMTVVVGSLHRLESLLPTLRALGQRHVRYGVKAVHYDTVGAALLWTLAQGLGPDFTPATRTAWLQAYTTLATVMQDAATTVQAA